jgi:hypothetical protein
MKRTKRIIFIGFALCVFIAAGAAAQEQGFGGDLPEAPETIEEEELDKFFEALSKIFEIQADFQNRLNEMVTDSPLSEERFNEINRLKTISPEQMDSVSENEARQFEELAVSIEDLNAKYQEQTTIIIQDEGLTLEEFQLIANYVNQNPEIMEERMN